MDLRALLSDDQIAVIGCFVALGACGLVAMLTYHFGSAGKKSQQPSTNLKFQPSATTSRPADSRKAA